MSVRVTAAEELCVMLAAEEKKGEIWAVCPSHRTRGKNDWVHHTLVGVSKYKKNGKKF